MTYDFEFYSAFLNFLLPAIGAIGSSIIGSRGASKAADKNAAAQAEAGDKNAALQREFAQSGVQWRVKDARAAGISPLAALGAQLHQASPSYVGANYDIEAQAAANMGQDFSRAVNAAATPTGRVTAFNKTVQDLTVTRMGLENQLLASQIARVDQAGMGPAMPSAEQRYVVDGQGPTAIAENPLIQDIPLKRVNVDPDRFWQEPGPVSDIGHSRTRTGYAPMMSTDAKERLEEDMLGGLAWNLRNRVMPSLGGNYSEPHKAPPGKFWLFNPFKQEYQLYDKWN